MLVLKYSSATTSLVHRKAEAWEKCNRERSVEEVTFMMGLQWNNSNIRASQSSRKIAVIPLDLILLG